MLWRFLRGLQRIQSTSFVLVKSGYKTNRNVSGVVQNWCFGGGDGVLQN